MSDLTHLSLFSGIGGLDLAAEWTGFKTVGQCEWADYPTKVLEKHWPDVPRWRDIRTLTKESFYERTGLSTVDVISGGYPCQPFSVAGKRRGKDDDRYLWPEMLRVISEIRPAWVVGENVAGIVSMALDEALSDLESLGYTVQAFIIPACAVDAPHKRDRCAIVAHTCDSGLQGRKFCETFNARRETEPYGSVSKRCETVADTGDTGIDGRLRIGQKSKKRRDYDKKHNAVAEGGHVEPGNWWPVEPDVGRVADGVPFRVDRLKCLGNAVVPQQFYPIFQAIADIERGQ